MTRTYRKVVKCGVCTGSNTEYYRDMNRKCRRKNNYELRNLLANYDIEDINDIIITHKPIHDDWNEPTDGTYIITKKDKEFWKDRIDWNRKIGKYLKPKKYKHYKIKK